MRDSCTDCFILHTFMVESHMWGCYWIISLVMINNNLFSDLTMEIVRYRLIGPLAHMVLTDTLHPANEVRDQWWHHTHPKVSFTYRWCHLCRTKRQLRCQGSGGPVTVKMRLTWRSINNRQTHFSFWEVKTTHFTCVFCDVCFIDSFMSCSEHFHLYQTKR